MNFFEKIVHFLSAEMQTPKLYGAFHLISFALVVLLSAFLIIKYRDTDDKTFRRIVLIFWIVFVLLEIYKQVVFAFEYNNSDPIWDYEWYAFPYQFCSTPHYVLPFIIFLPNGKLRDACISYMSFFSLLGGIAVMAYPGDVFIGIIGINIQTMFHHGMQLVFGIYFTVYNRKKLNLRYWLSSVPVFAVLTAVALLLNVGVYSYLTQNGMTDTFNMFYISPYFECTLPILSSIYSVVSYPVFLFLYIFALSLGSLIFYCIQKGIIKLACSGKKKEEAYV